MVLVLSVVMNVARAVWLFFGDGVLQASVVISRSCYLLLVWGLVPFWFVLLLGGRSCGASVRGSVPGVLSGLRYGAPKGCPRSEC